MNPSSPPPTTRKVAVVAKPNSPQSIIISDRPIAKPTGTQILIKIEASGVCATDLHLVRRSMPYLQPKGGIDVCGHEGVGRIVKLGPVVDAMKGWSVGQRVAHRWVWSWCGECEICKGGNEQLCDERRQSGVHVEGCWAEYTLVESKCLLRIPEQIDPLQAAPILCAGTTVYRALRVAQLSSGQWVSIVGAGGGLGHLAIQYAKAQGLRVLGIDGGKDKRALCTKLGVDAYIDFLETKDLTADVLQLTSGGSHGVLVTSSSARAYEQAVTYVRKMGVLVCIGITPKKMTFPVGPEYFIARDVRFMGTSTGTLEDTKEALEYVRKGEVQAIVVEKKLADIPDCLAALGKGDAVGRFVVKME